MADDYSADIHTVGTVAVGDTATGNLEAAGDRDWFAVDLVAGRTYTIDLRGSPTGDGTLSDTYLRGIHDADGALISGTTNDDGGTGYNSRATFTAAASGTYYIAAGAWSSRQGTYEVEVTENTAPADDYSADIHTTGTVAVGDTATGDLETAGDRDWFAVELVAGRTYTIELRGSPTGDGTLSDTYLRGIHDADGALISGTTNDDGGTGYNSRVTFTAAASGTHYIAAGAWSSRQGTYEVEVTENAAPADDYSADIHTTGTVAVGDTATGDLETAGDRDWFAVELVAGRTYTIELRGSPTGDGTLSDTYLRGIHDADGALISGTTNDDGGTGYNSRATFTAAESGTYYIAAGAWSSRQGTYEVEVTDNSPPMIQVADVEATEEVANPQLVFRVTLDRASSDPVMVSYETQDGTAHAGQDYVAAQGTLVFAPGETEKTVVVAIIDDLVEDSGEVFTLRLSNAQGGEIVDPQAVGTILNDDTDLRVDIIKNDELLGEIINNFSTLTGNFDNRTTGSGTVSGSDSTTFDGNRDQTVNTLTVGGAAVETEITRIELPHYSARPALNERLGTQYKFYDHVDGHATDIDWFKVTLESSKTYKVTVDGQRHSSYWADDPYLYGVFNSSGSRQSGTEDNDGGDVFDAQASFSPSADGTYYIALGMAHGSEPGYVAVSIEEVM